MALRPFSSFYKLLLRDENVLNPTLDIKKIALCPIELTIINISIYYKCNN